MKVILLQNIPALGSQGQTIEVKPGYGRNYLLPKKLALIATPASLRHYELIQRKQARVQEEGKKKAEELKTRIEKISLTLSAELKSEEEIYGSIPAQTILQALKNEGIDLDKDALILEEPLRKIGVYTLEVKLHPEISASFKVWVMKK